MVLLCWGVGLFAMRRRLCVDCRTCCGHVDNAMWERDYEDKVVVYVVDVFGDGSVHGDIGSGAWMTTVSLLLVVRFAAVY